MRSRSAIRPAAAADLGWMWPLVWPSRIFEHVGELEAYWSEAPWRVQVNSRGEGAVLGRWREHIPWMSIRGVWCASHHLEAMLGEIREVGRGQGFAGVLSPLVSEWESRAYVRAGMSQVQEIVVLRMEKVGRGQRPDGRRDVPGVELGTGTLRDLDEVLELDGATFDDFWRYDEELLRRYLVTDRVGLARADGRLVGYTLGSLSRGEGVLGRLGVHPEHRSAGIGTALLADAVDYFARKGVNSITLCTQEENEASRRLYARAGFSEAPERLKALAFRSLDQG